MLKIADEIRAIGLWLLARMPRLRRGEGLVMVLSAFIAMALNAMVIMKYHHRFTMGGRMGYYTLFTKTFHVSGFDPYSLIVMSNGQVCYDSSRHPLLTSLFYPLYWCNDALMDATGVNCAAYLMMTINILAVMGASMAMYRLLRYVMRLSIADSMALWMVMFSVAYIMLAAMVPDHFAMSLFLLVYTLYRAGLLIRFKRPMSPIEGFVLFFLTAGVTITNGAKTCLAMMFTAGRHCLSRSRVVALLLACMMLGGLWYWQQTTIEEPQHQRAHKIEQKIAQKDPKRVARERRLSAMRDKKNGKPLAENNALLRQSDVSTERLPSLWHNLFGETFILHEQHLLRDVQRNRPVFVCYQSPIYPAIEITVILTMALGLWYGRRDRFCWMLIAWLMVDALIHVGFGFALNEVYIMAAHWAFALPVLAAYCIRKHPLWRLFYLPALLMLIHNVRLICQYFMA